MPGQAGPTGATTAVVSTLLAVTLRRAAAIHRRADVADIGTAVLVLLALVVALAGLTAVILAAFAGASPFDALARAAHLPLLTGTACAAATVATADLPFADGLAGDALPGFTMVGSLAGSALAAATIAATGLALASGRAALMANADQTLGAGATILAAPGATGDASAVRFGRADAA